MKKNRQQKKQTGQRRKRKAQDAILYGGIGVIILSMAAVGILSVNRPASSISLGPMGEEAPILSAQHLEAGTVPGPYSTNPPAGGVHYEEDFEPGFYDEGDLAELPPYPEGYLVHNLEHGYVIFWYNCQAAGVDCDTLKQTVRDVMQEARFSKLIAFPWPDMDAPLAMTSWGRFLTFDTLDTEQMLEFVRRNYNQAPEPNMS